MKSILFLIGLIFTWAIASATESLIINENNSDVSNILTFDNRLINRTPTFECDSWPFEGIPFFRVKTDTFSLHEKPSRDSPLSKTIKIDKGSVVSFPFGISELIRHQKEGTAVLVAGMEINTKIILDKSIQVTLASGIIKATRNGIFKADSSYGKIKSCSEINDSKTKGNKEYHFKKGDIVENLLYLGEGECLFRYKDEIFVHHGCLSDTVGLQKESDPETEWWISFKIENKNVGWLQMTETNNPIELIDTVK